MKTRTMLFLTAAVAVALAVIVGAVTITLSTGAEPAPAPPVVGQTASAPAAGEGVDQQLEMVVFFQSPRRHDLLVPAQRSVFNTIALDQQASQLIQKLIQGPAPAEGLLPTVPGDCRLLRVFLAEDGTAYLFFDRALIDGHEGGTTGELMTIYSIVNTICVNLPSVHRVQIVIEGGVEELLAGHVDLSEPFELNNRYFSPGALPVVPDEVTENDESDVGD